MKIQILTSAIALCLGSAAMAQTDVQQPDPNADIPAGAVTMPDHAVPADPNVPRNPDARQGSAANPVVVGGNMTPAPAPKDHYPVCGGSIQDECMNPQAAHGRPL